MENSENPINSSNLMTRFMSEFSRLDFSIVGETGEQEVVQALNRTVLLGGKRLRPYLTLIFSELFKIQDWKTKRTLSECVEFIHAASLTHDDVIDQAEMRRGRESINISVGNKKSILAGDYLLSETIQRLSNLNSIELLKLTAQVIKELSLGEWLQHELLKTRNYSKDSLKKVCLYKTSSVMYWCALAPSFFINNNVQGLQEKLQIFGDNLGLAFQYIDDVLDFKKATGKSTQIDVKNQQLNMVTFHHLKRLNKLEEFKSGGDLKSIIEVNNLGEDILLVEKEAHVHLENCERILFEIFEDLQVVNDSDIPKTLISLLKQLKSRSA